MMWLQLIVSAVTSNVAKSLIALLVNKLLEAKGDGVTKDVAIAMLDGIARSRANNVPENAFDAIKQSL